MNHLKRAVTALTAAIVVNKDREKSLEVFVKVADKLARLGAEILVSDSGISKGAVKFCDEKDIYFKADVVIAIGGDGTMLRAAHGAVKADIPIMGINTGKIGFMTSMEPDQTDLLDMLIYGSCVVESRMLIDVSVQRGGECVFNDFALNDAVVSHGSISKILDIALYNSDEYIASYRADGIIFSTPTGSTAYSLSAGGPVVDPAVEAVLVTPVCSHSIASRSIVFRAESILQASVASMAEAYVTVDGLMNFRLERRDRIFVKRSDRHVRFLKFSDRSFYRILSEKLK